MPVIFLGFYRRIKVTKEDIIIAGQMGTDTKYMGYKGKGSITLYHVSSRMHKLIGE
ncbi:phage tail tube protein, partial [Clostridioides difficile]